MIRCGFMLIMLAATAAPAATNSSPADPLVDAAVAAVKSGNFAPLIATVEKAATEAMADPAVADLPRLVQLATLREFGRWFARVPQQSPEQKEALMWLIRQRRAAPALLLSATGADPPDRALAILTALRKDRGDRLEQFPELMAAICLVWDDGDRFGGDDRPIEESRILGVFRHYAENRGTTRNAATDLPVDQLIFVVDNLLSEGEIDRVRRQHAPLDVGGAFFDVGYGPTRNLTRQPPKSGDDPTNAYTLANLRKFGGRLGDQAYYAAQVGKVFGVPTATCVGLEREGQESQGWVAFMNGRGQDARWDTTSGRYRLHYASPGEFLDPQTMEHLPLAELALVAGVGRTAAAKRSAGIALCKLLDLAPPQKQLAALRRTVELSPWDRRMWRAVGDWSQRHKPGTDDHAQLIGLVSSHLLPRCEEAAMHVRLRMIAKLPAEDRAAALAELGLAFARRADLVATIQLARAEALLEKKDDDGALRVLGQLLSAADALPAHAVPAMRHVDDILRERSQLDRLATAYEQLWSRLRPPPQSPVSHTTPYYAIGREYAQLLEELGRQHELTRLRENLAQLWGEPVRR
ncbi:MAG TPA: hypothetical protein VGR35_03710 [Tepidisphaeraceae bacterium]|nr:hypothetical protein [Tepidisphaeraceae bacterium]